MSTIPVVSIFVLTDSRINSEQMGSTTHLRCVQSGSPGLLCDLLRLVPGFCYHAEASKVCYLVSNPVRYRQSLP